MVVANSHKDWALKFVSSDGQPSLAAIAPNGKKQL